MKSIHTFSSYIILLKKKHWKTISMKKFWQWLTDIGGDNAMGPNGFTMDFWLKCWGVVWAEVMDFLHELHYSGLLEEV